jgi:formylglycine-generating enzyme required for sulfatase activity
MRRVASGILVACGLAVVALSTACGGEEFTTALAADGAATTESSRPPAGEASAGSDATADGGVDPGSPPDAGPRPPEDATTPANGCPAGRGAAMVLVDSICIDSTEARNDEYNDFLLAGPPLAGQPAACSWNASYLPGNGWTFAASQARLPIAYVNWCDAYAFCSWAGKRLCGKVGGGSANFSQFASKDNEHYLACSNAATRIYPYGNAFDPAACNDIAHDAGHVLPVGSLPACQGGVPGLFDMSGNVEEWQDACSADSGPKDSCLDGTGAFDFGDEPGGTRCDFADYDVRSGQFPDVGIRCCATPR